MSTQSILNWIVCVTSNLLPSQSQTLALLVVTAIRLEWPNLAQIGREMPGSATATVKRAWRFTRNERVEVADAMAGVIKRLARKRKNRLLISFDWVQVRDFHTFMAAACIGGRAVPLLWATYLAWKPLRSQNSLEEGLLRLLKSLLPPSARVVILADRGFGPSGRPSARSWASTTWSGSGPTSRCPRSGIGARCGSTRCTRGSPTCYATSITARTGGCGTTS